MLLPNQKTVVAGNSRNHTEQVTSGYRQERNPTPEDLSCAVANLGQDHHSFNDPLWARSLVMGHDSLQTMQAGSFATRTTMAQQQQTATLQWRSTHRGSDLNEKREKQTSGAELSNPMLAAISGSDFTF